MIGFFFGLAFFALGFSFSDLWGAFIAPLSAASKRAAVSYCCRLHSFANHQGTPMSKGKTHSQAQVAAFLRVSDSLFLYLARLARRTPNAEHVLVPKLAWATARMVVAAERLLRTVMQG